VKYLNRCRGTVAAQAIHGEVLVSRVDDIVPDRVAGVLHPRVAGIAQIDRVRVVDQGDEIGGMGLVALRALPSWIGLCLVTDASCRRAVSWWQELQTVFIGPRRRASWRAACGAWQFPQEALSSRGQWIRFLPNVAFIMSEWHPRQSSNPGRLALSASGDGGSRWHWLHIFFATGEWTFFHRIPAWLDPWGS